LAQRYYEIVVGGREYLLPAQHVVANVDRREAEMVGDEQDRPVGWLTLSYRRVPVFSLLNLFPGHAREWTRALVIQGNGSDPVGLAVEAVHPAETGAGATVEMVMPGNRIPGGSPFTQALLEGDTMRLIINPERLAAHLHGRPRI
jgi:hypothetical protein